ncbi:MAG: hypothetical protein ACTSYD_01595 [Candidatus Heimdallarchaeaceae archaeon]
MALINGNISFILAIIASVGIFVSSIVPELFKLPTIMKWLVRSMFVSSAVCLLVIIGLDSMTGSIFLSLGLGVTLLCKGLISNGRIRYVYFLLATLFILTEVLVYDHPYYFIIWLLSIYMIFISIVAQFLNVRDDVPLTGTTEAKKRLWKITVVLLLLAIVGFVVCFNEYYYPLENQSRAFSFANNSGSIPSQVILAFILIMSGITIFIGFLYVIVMTKSTEFLEVTI